MRGAPCRDADIIIERSSRVVGKANPHELPPGIRWEEVSIREPRVRRGCRARCAAQHPLVGHPFAVVLADCARVRLESRIAHVRTLRPLPDVTVELRQRVLAIARRTSRSRMKALALDES